MRFSHQGFGTSANNLNSSLMLPPSAQSIDMNVTQNIHSGSVGQIGNMTTSGTAQTKQWLN
jgi:EAL domain-containing protein (putative c-di-GMP-specific phosphodiesterase class I)